MCKATQRVLVVGSLVVWLLACGSTPPAIPPPPSQGGPAWHELTSKHFTVWTDSSPEQALALVRKMERLRQVVLGVSFFQQESPARSFVIAFRNMEEVRAYVPPQFIAHAWSARNLLAQPVIVLSVSSLEDDLRIVTHELTHVIAFNLIPDQPAWFSEGLAGYFETIRLDEDGGKVTVGRPLEFRMHQIRSSGLTPTASLFACDLPVCMDDRFYATTWALVTYLINEQPAALTRYLKRLAETPKDEQSKLWAEVFPSLPPATIDRELARWTAYGKIKVNEYNVAFQDAASTSRNLVDADVLAARGLLRYLFAPKSLPAEVTHALSLDPTGVLQNLIHASVTSSIDANKATQIAAAHPDDWRAWMLVTRATWGSKDSREALAKMCSLLASNPAAVPPEACSPGALDPANDPRGAVFKAAVPQINACFVQHKHQPSNAMSLEIDISDSGAVKSARATVGSPEVNGCIEGVLRGLTFPPQHPGVFHVGSSSK